MMVSINLRLYWPALTLALFAIIGGGLISAITAQVTTPTLAWVNAYLVLVGGVGTGGLAIGRDLLSPSRPNTLRLVFELSTWVIGNLLIIFGTLSSPTGLVETGSVLLATSLCSVLLGVRKGAGASWVRGLFALLLYVLLLSIPIGVLLSHLRR